MSNRTSGQNWTIAALAVGAISLFSALSKATDAIHAASIPIWIAALGALGWVLNGSLGKALAAKLRGDAAPDAEELEYLRARVAELEGVEPRLLELEERVDFAERLLSRVDDPARIARGQP